MVIFLDTNVLLHYAFDDADWEAIVGESVERILTCWVNLHELDRIKDTHPNSRRRDRARRVLRMIEEAQAADSDTLLGRGSEFAFYSAQPKIDFASLELDPTHPDHRLVATAWHYQNAEGAEVALATHDVTPRIAADLVGLRAVDMPADLKLPASEDPQAKEIRRLRGELERERARRPNLAVDIGGELRAEIDWSMEPLQVPALLFDEVVALQAEKYPRPSRRYQNTDPALIPPDAQQEERRIAGYLNQLPDWLDALNTYMRDNAHRQPLTFQIRNDGTAPATDVALELSFPLGVCLKTKASVPDPPQPPRVPISTPADRSLNLQRTMARILPYGTWIAGRNVSPVSVGKDASGSWRAGVRFKKLTQQRGQATDPIWIEFNGEEAHSFQIEVTIIADELPTELKQDLHVVVRRTQFPKALTAEDVASVLADLATM